MADNIVCSAGAIIHISENTPETFDRQGFEACFDQSEIVGELNSSGDSELRDSLEAFGFTDSGEMDFSDGAGVLGALMSSLNKFDHGFDFNDKMRDDFIRKKTYGRSRY